MRVKILTEVFYFDTYALVEIARGNPNYSKYRESVNIMLNKLNLMEYAYFLLRIKKENKIQSLFNEYIKYNIEPSINALIEAVKFKLVQRKNKLSYIDCLGYMIAKENRVKFLTGDEKFRNMDNVEFVK